MLLGILDAPVHSFQAVLLNIPGYRNRTVRTHLKNVFWPNIFVGASFQILNNQQVASGLKLSPAAILNQNPIFEFGSSSFFLAI
jgi:hypothetical protein